MLIQAKKYQEKYKLRNLQMLDLIVSTERSSDHVHWKTND